MPIVSYKCIAGEPERRKDRLAEAITEDIVKILNVGKEEVIILFTEASHGNWYSSGYVYKEQLRNVINYNILHWSNFG